MKTSGESQNIVQPTTKHFNVPQTRDLLLHYSVNVQTEDGYIIQLQPGYAGWLHCLLSLETIAVSDLCVDLCSHDPVLIMSLRSVGR